MKLKAKLIRKLSGIPPPPEKNKQTNKQTKNPLQFDKLTQSKQDCDRHVNDGIQRKNGNWYECCAVWISLPYSIRTAEFISDFLLSAI